MISINRIKELNAKYYNHIVEFRKHLHAHPELSFEEKNTAAYIQSILDKDNISYSAGWAENGVVAQIGNGMRCVALRADIDALPIQEANDVPYKSQNEGVMHACGHDVHTASLLGTCLIIKELEDDLPTSVKIIFQPGEEKLPGGASLLIKEGVLKNPDVEIVLGQHVHPAMEVGKIGVCPGPFMASADEIYITVKGKGGHAAMPEHCIDTIMVATEIIPALHKIPSRYAPKEATVLSIGKINSIGGATNIIPDEVKIEGTFRAYNEEWRKKAHRLIEQVAKGIAKAHSATCEVNIVKGYPFLNNDPELTSKVKEGVAQFVGQENVFDLPKRMTGEDFAYYSHEVPSCFYRLGTGNAAKNITSQIHTSTFDVDEEVFRFSSGLMAWLTVMLRPQRNLEKV